ncbi:hypothetical protein OEG84_13080 [Hoeflea sp. G2-23]|uniref:Uncharacterized protein n=1 Tax=Hoeflea algicola TaxID=2983763 RepID=A0ABT3Z9Z8_9HYPH|nr:hypothetical protein [Hoeflea algicola]MCY0148614.1 hypothetical protein [Hoeflea algicola]
MDEVNGDNRAELLDGSFIEITFDYQIDGKATLKSKSHTWEGPRTGQALNSDE